MSNNSAQLYGNKKFNNDYNIADTIISDQNLINQTYDQDLRLNNNADIFKTPQPKLSHKIQAINAASKDTSNITLQN